MALDLPARQGDVVKYEAHGRILEVKKIRGPTYFMKVVGTERARFADFADHARSDIEHFLETGVLPRSKESWY